LSVEEPLPGVALTIATRIRAASKLLEEARDAAIFAGVTIPHRDMLYTIAAVRLLADRIEEEERVWERERAKREYG
jgi:hypothetical protein